jgi:hypothetical protein
MSLSVIWSKSLDDALVVVQSPKDSNMLFVGGQNQYFYNIATESTQQIMKVHERIFCASFQPIGDLIVVGSDDCSWSLHNVYT